MILQVIRALSDTLQAKQFYAKFATRYGFVSVAGITPTDLEEKIKKLRVEAKYELKLCDDNYQKTVDEISKINYDFDKDGTNLSRLASELEKIVALLGYNVKEYMMKAKRRADSIQYWKDECEKNSVEIAEMEEQIIEMKNTLDGSQLMQITDNELIKLITDKAVRFYEEVNAGRGYAAGSSYEGMVRCIIKHNGLNMKAFAYGADGSTERENVVELITEQLKKKTTRGYTEKTSPGKLLKSIILAANHHTQQGYQYSILGTFKNTSFMDQCKKKGHEEFQPEY